MKRILVIDDDRLVRHVLRQMLERRGYEVIDASDGKEGMKLYRQNPTDLVITDILMPEKEGVETIIELKRDFPDVKIIAISGGSSHLDAKKCLSYLEGLGVSYKFTKPFDRKEFLEAVQELLVEVVVP